MTDTKKTQTILQGIVKKIVSLHDPERIVLFGSRAWGEPHQESDIDLLIEKKHPTRAPRPGILIAHFFLGAFLLILSFQRPSAYNSGELRMILLFQKFLRKARFCMSVPHAVQEWFAKAEEDEQSIKRGESPKVHDLLQLESFLLVRTKSISAHDYCG